MNHRFFVLHILIINALSINVRIIAMEEQQVRFYQEELIGESVRIPKEEQLVPDVRERIAIIKDILGDNEMYIQVKIPDQIEKLRSSISAIEKMSQQSAYYLLMELYRISNALRTIRDRLIIVKDSLNQMPLFREKNLLLNKIRPFQQQSYSLLQQLASLLSLITSNIPKLISDAFSIFILSLESLSFADKIEHALQSIDIDTKRVESQGWFTPDVGIFEHGKLLRGARQRAIIERTPIVPKGLPPQELKQILGDMALKELVSDYKIHLMPKDSDLECVAITLLNAIKQNPELQQNIGLIKIKALKEPFVELQLKKYKDQPFPISEQEKIPKIVIYVGGGKEKVQRVLDIIYDFFKDQRGLDRAPAFNERITSLIYVAQGNRDDKVKYPQFFDEGLIYYKPDITGVNEDYHLINPASPK